MGNPRDVRFLKRAMRPEQYPHESLPEVAFVGRSNVGKSSLINGLLGRKRLAPTSQTPGKTQLIHFYQVDDRFVLVDLPGYGYARATERVRRRWKPMVERYLSSRESLCLVVFLVDFRRMPSDLDLQLKHWLEHHAMPYILVLTKVDKISRGNRLAQVRKIAEGFGMPSEDLMLFSAVTNEGRRKLWRSVLDAVEAAALAGL